MKTIATITRRSNEAILAAYVRAQTHAATQAQGKKRFNQVVLMLVLMALTTPVFAQGDDFSGFLDAIEEFAGGNFAIAVSILSLVLGALFGLAKMTVWPAFTGFAVAAVFAAGPYMINQIFSWFSL